MDLPIANPCKIDALNYIKEVKETFENQVEKYHMFLEITKDFKAGRVGTFGVMTRIKNLFEGHNSLINGFDKFLPRGYSMSGHEQAVGYVNKIKRRFEEDRQVYDSFLKILKVYRRDGNRDVAYKEISELFKDHPDFLDEFRDFMPGSHEAKSTVTEEVSCVDKSDQAESCSSNGSDSTASSATSLMQLCKL